MKYVALLRGINVGKNISIKMADLKQAVSDAGFSEVKTYIQSGNVVFESADKDVIQIESVLQSALYKAFQFDSGIVVLTYEQLKKVLLEVPPDWKMRHDLRCYIAFIKRPATVKDVMRDIELKEGVDSVNEGEIVIYMSSLLSGLTRSRFTKLISKAVYKNITIRNYATTQKIMALRKTDK
jgi:uncharacterized protein (DUF1697 family)